MANVTIAQMNAGGSINPNDTGTAVPQLRTYLATAGYSVSSSSSTYDAATQTKAIAFQTAFGATPDGIVGPITWNLLKKYHDSYNNPVVSNGTSNFKFTRNTAQVVGVRNLQEDLNELGYPTGTPDGRFGSGTLKSVLMFQLHHNLTVDGIAGSTTVNKAATIANYSGGRLLWGKQYAGGSCADKQSSMSDSEIVARCMYGESGNDTEGMKCVAQVIQNRVNSAAYPNSVRAVVFQNNQFTAMYRVNGTCVAPDRSSSKWNKAVNAVGGSYNSTKVYHQKLKDVNCVRFRTAAEGEVSTSSTYVCGGNRFSW